MTRFCFTNINISSPLTILTQRMPWWIVEKFTFDFSSSGSERRSSLELCSNNNQTKRNTNSELQTIHVKITWRNEKIKLREMNWSPFVGEPLSNCATFMKTDSFHNYCAFITFYSDFHYFNLFVPLSKVISTFCLQKISKQLRIQMRISNN